MHDLHTDFNNNYIRYANCWEDADVLLRALCIRSGDRVLSIGSGGDNSFSLLVDDPELVVIVDMNPLQLQLIKLKKAAFETLDYGSFLQFLGFRASTKRWALFARVQKRLSTESAAYWSKRKKTIEAGIIYRGKLERYFCFFNRWILPLIHSKNTIQRLLAGKNENEQKSFFENHWNTKRWRSFIRLFFSKQILGLFGRDPTFFKEVGSSVSSFILSQVDRHLSSICCQKNHFLRFILTGSYGDVLPHYARAEHFYKIKSRLDRIAFHHGLVESALKMYGDLNKFNLSNIFEYMNTNQFCAVSKRLVGHCRPGSRFAYWNLMVPRKMSETIVAVKPDRKVTVELGRNDNGFFYGAFNIDVKS